MNNWVSFCSGENPGWKKKSYYFKKKILIFEVCVSNSEGSVSIQR